MIKTRVNRDRTWFFVILGLGIVLRIVLWAVVPWDEFGRSGDEASYYRAGLRLALLQVQDVWWPPMAGWVVAGLSMLLGTELLVVFRLVWVVIDVLNMVLVFRFTRRLTGAPFSPSGHVSGLRLPLAAMAAYSVYLPALGYATHVTGEALSLAFLLGALNVIDYHAPFRPGRMILGGIFAGLVVLTRPNLAPFALAVAAALLILNRTTRPLIRKVAIPATLFVAAAILPPAVWATRNYVTTGYMFVNLSMVNGGDPTTSTVPTGQLRLVDSTATELEVDAREKVGAKLQKLNEQLASTLAARSRDERRRVLREGFLNVTPISASEVFGGRLRSILGVGSVLEQLRTQISKLGRTLAPKTGSFDMMSRATELTDPLKFGVFALANIQWALVLLGGVVGILGATSLGGQARLLLASVIPGCLVAILFAHGEPRYSFPFEFALMIGAVAFLFSSKDTLAALAHSRWRLAAVVILFLFIGVTWIAAARWGFSDSLRSVW